MYTKTKDLTVTPLIGNGTNSSFYVIRHIEYASTELTTYRLRVSTSEGNVTIPQLGGTLTLNGRDSKIHLVDYPLAEVRLIYSSAEVFTWKKFGDQIVLLLYCGEGELHEMEVQVSGATSANVIEGSSTPLKIQSKNSTTIINGHCQGIEESMARLAISIISSLFYLLTSSL